MRPKTLAVIFIGALLFAFLFSGCIQQSIQQEFKYEWEDEGILFQSDFGEPKVLLREFTLKPKIIVGAELALEKTSENPEIFNNSVIPFYVVVAGNDRNAIQLIMFVENGKLQECETNYGNVRTQVSLESKECSEFIEKWNTELFVFFPLPDSSLKRSSIVLEESRITVKARNVEEQAVLSQSLAEHLFPNAQEILEKAKEKLRELK